MTTPTLAELISQIQPRSSGAYSAQLTSDWLQGRSGFGGVMAALAVAALRQHIGDERPLRALLTSFVGPAGAGALQVECKTLRQGKSVLWAQATILQEGAVCTTFSACFGKRRDSVIAVQPGSRPSVKPPAEGVQFPGRLSGAPAFMQHFDLRWVIGQVPVSGSQDAEMGVWVRFRQPAGFGESHVAALMDVLPPAVLQMLTELRPISSLSWHLELLDDLRADDARDGEGWWFFHVFAQAAANGYSQQQATLYTPTGRALAMSQQVIAVFA